MDFSSLQQLPKPFFSIIAFMDIFSSAFKPTRCTSSEDVAVVVDFHWFTDSHLEAIFNMNASRVQLRPPTTVDGKDVRLTTGVSH